MNDVQQHYDAGFHRFREGDLEGAIVELESALRIAPDHVPSLRTIAMACFRKGDYVRALEFGERNVAADPKDVVAHSSLSLFLMKNGRVKDAETVAAKAKLMTWKRQIKDAKEGVSVDAPGLNILETSTPQPIFETAPMMPLGLSPPRPPVPPAPPATKSAPVEPETPEVPPPG